jgi:hypothetical protein
MNCPSGNSRLPDSPWRSRLPLFGIGIVLALLTTGCDPDQIGADSIPAAKGLSAASAPSGLEASPRVNVSATNAASQPAPNSPEARQTGERLLGLVFYPEAKALSSPSSERPLAGTDELFMAVLETDDSVEKVVAFYKQNYPPTPPVREAEAAKERRVAWQESKLGNARFVEFSITDPQYGNSLRTGQITAEGGKTRIELMHVPATQAAREIFTTPATLPTPALPPAISSLSSPPSLPGVAPPPGSESAPMPVVPPP